ncbi:MAG: (Fe-S)-binding protein, partial [Acidobacteriaceae bacterium]
MRITLFITCYNDTLFPGTGQAVVRVLERLGHTVEFPLDQTCCGQMHFNTGYRREAYPLAKRLVEVFTNAEAVCIPSSSCVAMIREYYPTLARENNDAAMATALDTLLPRIYEFSEL